MKALVFEPKRGLYLDSNRATPEPQAGEALIQMRQAGICNTDLEITRGYMEYSGVLGHEFVGTVVEVNDPEAKIWVGQRVVGEINAACGHCFMCETGNPTHCLNRTTLGIVNRDGALAEYLRLPIANLHAVPEEITDSEAAFVEPLAAACEILEQIHIRPTERVVVIGDGKLGLLISQVLRLTGANLTLIGRHSEKGQIVQDLGVNYELSPANDADAQARLIEKHRLADIVVECTGNESGLALAKQLVRPRGTIILKSTYHGVPAVPLSLYVVDEIRIVGSRCGPFAPALRLLERGLIETEWLVTSVFGLENGEDAFRRAFEPGVIKVQITTS